MMAGRLMRLLYCSGVLDTLDKDVTVLVTTVPIFLHRIFE